MNYACSFNSWRPDWKTKPSLMIFVKLSDGTVAVSIMGWDEYSFLLQVERQPVRSKISVSYASTSFWFHFRYLIIWLALLHLRNKTNNWQLCSCAEIHELISYTFEPYPLSCKFMEQPISLSRNAVMHFDVLPIVLSSSHLWSFWSLAIQWIWLSLNVFEFAPSPGLPTVSGSLPKILISLIRFIWPLLWMNILYTKKSYGMGMSGMARVKNGYNKYIW